MAATDTTLEMMVTKVPVMADWAPTTSVLRRFISSPVLVAVKNRNDIRCRWANNSHLRSKMIPSPTRDDHHRWATPTRALISGTRIIPAPSSVSCAMSSFAIASSTSSRISIGGTTPSPDMTRMVTSTPTSAPR